MSAFVRRVFVARRRARYYKDVRGIPHLRLKLGVAVACFAVAACARSEAVSHGGDVWQYPIRLGDTRSTAHRVLNSPVRATGMIEEYPMSGVAVLFDSEERVAKLTFFGAAAALYAPTPTELLASSHPVLFGLPGEANEVAFRRALGQPLFSAAQRADERRERRCVWKKNGYVIDALFLATPRSDPTGKDYVVGSLLWFEVTR